MREHAVEINAGEVRLGGTLALPEGEPPCPVVLFLHGSGPLDRDENMAGQRLDVFNTLAAHCARMGVASLRFDKRGCGRSTGDYLAAGQAELLADATACLDHLASAHPGRFTARYLLGHSEGTLLAARLSLERAVDGLVLIAPFLAKIEDLLMTQAAHIEAMQRSAPGLGGFLNRVMLAAGLTPRAAQRRLIARLRSSSAATFRNGARPIEAKSLRELLAIDPREIYARVRAPMLLIAGGKDIQCDPQDATRIAELAGPSATAVILPDLTHILRRDPGPASFSAYAALLAQPVDAEVLRLAGDWIAAQ